MKEKRFEVRLTEKEYAQLEKKSQRAGITKAALLRKYISDEPLIDKELLEQLRNLEAGQNRIGNNINQIARKWNESGSDYRDIAFLREKQSELYSMLQEVRTYCHVTYSSKRK